MTLSSDDPVVVGVALGWPRLPNGQKGRFAYSIPQEKTRCDRGGNVSQFVFLIKKICREVVICLFFGELLGLGAPGDGFCPNVVDTVPMMF